MSYLPYPGMNNRWLAFCLICIGVLVGVGLAVLIPHLDYLLR